MTVLLVLHTHPYGGNRFCAHWRWLLQYRSIYDNYLSTSLLSTSIWIEDEEKEARVLSSSQRLEVHAPAALPKGKNPGTNCIGGWVSPRDGLNGCGKYRPPLGFDSRTAQPVASRYTDYSIRPIVLFGSSGNPYTMSKQSASCIYTYSSLDKLVRRKKLKKNREALNAACQRNISKCNFRYACHRFASPGLK